MALCGIDRCISIMSLIETSLKLLKQLAKIWITGSSFRLRKKQRLVLHFMKMKR